MVTCVNTYKPNWLYMYIYTCSAFKVGVWCIFVHTFIFPLLLGQYIRYTFVAFSVCKYNFWYLYKKSRLGALIYVLKFVCVFFMSDYLRTQLFVNRF